MGEVRKLGVYFLPVLDDGNGGAVEDERSVQLCAECAEHVPCIRSGYADGMPTIAGRCQCCGRLCEGTDGTEVPAEWMRALSRKSLQERGLFAAGGLQVAECRGRGVAQCIH